jgi:hypothetical protein
MAMTGSKPRPSITQLSFQRKWKLAQLEHGRLSRERETMLPEDIEALDLHMAALSSEDMADLAVKIDRLAELLWPSVEPMPEDCLEHVLLASVLRDIRALSQRQL